MTHSRSLLTKEWYKVPLSVDCPSCGAQTRAAGIVVGPSSLTGDPTNSAENNILAKPPASLDAFAFVETLSGRTKNIERFVVNRFHSMFAFRNDCLMPICEHCTEALPSPTIRSSVMNGFVRLGQRRLLVNERLLIYSSNAVLTEFHGGTSIEETDFPYPDYAVVLVCDTEIPGGDTGTFELWHSIARNDYAVLVRGHDGRDVLRDVINDDLASVVATVSDLGLVLTQLHLAQASSPYCALARDLFLKALGDAGYQQVHQEADHAVR